jgi:hypothetical protein
MKPDGIYESGEFRNEALSGPLQREKEIVTLNRRAFDVLLYFTLCRTRERFSRATNCQRMSGLTLMSTKTAWRKVSPRCGALWRKSPATTATSSLSRGGGISSLYQCRWSHQRIWRFSPMKRLDQPRASGFADNPRIECEQSCPSAKVRFSVRICDSGVPKRTARTNFSHIKSFTMWRLVFGKRDADSRQGG